MTRRRTEDVEPGRRSCAAGAFPGPGIDAVVFDLDGVVTETAHVHAAAWKRTFDEYLRLRSERTGEPFRPFSDEDYARHVDGKPRYDGARAFLESRGISLPVGDPADAPGAETVAGLANAKNERFLRVLAEEGAESYASSVRLIRELRDAGVRTALITASRNGRAVADAAGVTGLFDAIVDGADAEEAGLAGKPAPDVFLHAARLVGVPKERAAVVEDAQAGVEAGRRGGFALVLGVDRFGRAEELRRAGADRVVGDLGELAADARGPGAEGAGGAGRAGRRLLSELPSALDAWPEIVERLARGRPAAFLDFDGTLAPIVDRHAEAAMPPPVREAVTRLAGVVPVAIVSGRDLADVRQRAGVPGVYYAGSHGFEIVAPDGTPVGGERARGFERFLPALERAEEELRRGLAGLPGVALERKRYTIAVHYRLAPPEAVPAARRAVEHAASSSGTLRMTGGKKVFELRPDIDWDKGEALLLLLRVPGLGGPAAVPLVLGDDVTDEDAFAAVRSCGVAVAVLGEEDRPTLAHYSLDDVGQTGELLGRLAGELGERGAG
ncbi:MAG: trehalose-phosphatase [Coriobacteriia bacterium]|nr:trehalose-phosphatase [Coriobacteriia bacterium]